MVYIIVGHIGVHMVYRYLRSSCVFMYPALREVTTVQNQEEWHVLFAVPQYMWQPSDICGGAC